MQQAEQSLASFDRMSGQEILEQLFGRERLGQLRQSFEIEGGKYGSSTST
jgi:hypothetical protein